MNIKPKDVAIFLCDLVFPVAIPLSTEQLEHEYSIRDGQIADCAARVGAIPDANESDIVVYLAESAKLQDDEDDRKQGVESRLTSILGLSSIAGTIVFGGILALVVGTIQAPTGFVSFGMVAGTLYLALQLCSGILASVRGLEGKGYYTALASDVLPAPNETQPSYLKRQITETVARLGFNRMRNNEKVSQMATAHRAMKNFIGALILIAVVGAIVGAATRPADNNLIRTLRNDHELNELLRGPQGPKGDPGPRGPNGESGIKTSPLTEPHNKKP